MARPDGMTLTRITFGTAATIITGTPLAMRVTFTPTTDIIWAATGDVFVAFDETIAAASSGRGQVWLPNPDQNGFVDGAGNTIRNFAYKVTAVYTLGGAVVTRNTKYVTWTASDVGPIDLDLLIPVNTSPAVTVYIPDSWSAQVTAAEAAAQSAAASLAAILAGGTVSVTGNSDGTATVNGLVATNVLTPRTTAATVTASGALTAGRHTPVDATTGNLTQTLPSSATVGAPLSVEKTDPSGNTVAIAGSIRGAATTLTLTTQYESLTFIWSGATWRPTEGHRTKTAIDSAIDGKIAAARLFANVKDYGATLNGSTDDSAAVQAAHDALAAGGTLYFPGGTCYLASNVSISKTIAMRGAGRGDLGSGAAGIGSTIEAKSGATTLFTVTAGSVVFEDLTFLGSGITAAAANSGQGTAVQVTSGDRVTFNRTTFQSFYRHIWFQNCANWIIRDSYLDAASKYHVHVQNVATPDSGDQVITGSTFVSTGAWTADAQVRQESGGGLKISDSKFYATAAARCVDAAIADGVSTSILLLSNNSFEHATTSPVRLTHSGASHTGTFKKVAITGNQFTCDGGLGAAVDVIGLGSTAASLDRVNIASNIFDGGKTGQPFIRVQNARGVNIAANQFTNGSTGVLVDATAQNVHVDSSNQFVDVDVLVSGAPSLSVDRQHLVGTPYLAQRAGTYHDPSSQANATIAAGAVLDSGQQVVNNTGVNPIKYVGGQLAHNAASASGSSTSGYLQVPVSGVVRRMAAECAWAANALGAIAFVVPSITWVPTGTLPVAGVHLTAYGNGQWNVGVWNPASGQTGHIDHSVQPGTAATFTLTVADTGGTQTTATLTTATLTAATLQSTLQALSNVGGGNATVTKSASGNYGITWGTGIGTVTLTATGTGMGFTGLPAAIPAVIAYTSGVNQYATHLTSGRYATVWDGVLRWFEMYVFPEKDQILLLFPDGTSSGLITHPGVGLWSGNGTAIFELFENNSPSIDVPAVYGRIYADSLKAQPDIPAVTKPDVVALLSASKTQTLYDGGNTGTSDIASSGSIPPGTAFLEVVLIGGSGGGGSGACGASGTAINGGSAGGSAGIIREIIPASALGSTWTGSVGTKGVGGASISTAGTGTAGTNGTLTKFTCGSTAYQALAGGLGAGGTTGATGPGAGGAGGPFATIGSAAPGSGGAGTNGGGITANLGVPGSASGGGITTTPTANNGGVGGSNLVRGYTGGTAGIVGGAAPGVGTDITATVISAPVAGVPGPGVGGGAASTSGAAQAGATPVAYGVGGGGGGASLTGNASGKGGDGKGGYLLVRAHLL